MSSVEEEGRPKRIKSEDLIEPLTRRINPSGTQEIVIRPYGDSQIEIIVPEVDQREVDRIKRLVEEAGILRFAILANQRDHQADHQPGRTAQAESDNSGIRTSETIKDAQGKVVAFWANVDREDNERLGMPAGAKKGPLRVNVGDAIVRDPETGEIIDLAV